MPARPAHRCPVHVPPAPLDSWRGFPTGPDAVGSRSGPSWPLAPRRTRIAGACSPLLGATTGTAPRSPPDPGARLPVRPNAAAHRPRPRRAPSSPPAAARVGPATTPPPHRRQGSPRRRSAGRRRPPTCPGCRNDRSRRHLRLPPTQRTTPPGHRRDGIGTAAIRVIVRRRGPACPCSLHEPLVARPRLIVQVRR